MSTVSRGPASFLFVALRPDGGRTMGVRRALTQGALFEQLRRERLVPLQTWQMPRWAGAAARLKLKDQAELNQQLAQLLGRGVPLVEALEVVASAVSAGVRPVVDRMREAVSGGSSFADACAAAGCFDRVSVAVYRAAERTGDLAGAAKQLAQTAKRQLAVSGKAATLMIYPAVVMSISLVISLLMLTVIVPRIGRSLEGAGFPLPWYSKVTIGAGEFIAANALVLGLVAAGLLVLAVVLRRGIGEMLMRVMRTAPMIRDVVTAQESARFFTVMAAMTRSGVPLSDGLGVAVGAVGHPELRRQLTTLRSRLIEGGVLRHLIETVTALPLATRRLLIAAERSGDLESAFDALAGDMAEEVEKRSARLLAGLEPLLIVVMFVMIGSLLLSIMIPLMQLASKAL